MEIKVLKFSSAFRRPLLLVVVEGEQVYAENPRIRALANLRNAGVSILQTIDV